MAVHIFGGHPCLSPVPAHLSGVLANCSKERFQLLFPELPQFLYCLPLPISSNPFTKVLFPKQVPLPQPPDCTCFDGLARIPLPEVITVNFFF